MSRIRAAAQAAPPVALALIVALGLAVAAPAALAQASPEPIPLTLEQAIDLAREHNPAVRQAENEVESARAGELLSRAEFLPSLSASFSSSGSYSRRRTGENDFGQPVEGDVREFTGSSSNQGISLGLQLFDGGVRLRSVRAAAAGRDAAIAGVAAAERTTEAEVARRYYAAQRAAAQIDLEEALLRAAMSRHEATQRLLRVAAASPVDLLGTEYEVARQQQAVEDARGAARVAMLALAEQVGDPGAFVADLALVTAPPEVFDPSTLDAAGLVARAEESSPQLRQIGFGLRQAEHQLRAAGAARWPTINASANFNRSIGVQGYGALFDPNPFDQNFGFGLSFSLPLFSQYQTSQRIAQARAATDNVEERARQTRLQIDREVRTALIELERAYHAVDLNRTSTDLARRRLELANERYRLGGLSFAELQQIIESAATAEREALDATYAFAAALATLEERVGRVGR